MSLSTDDFFDNGYSARRAYPARLYQGNDDPTFRKLGNKPHILNSAFNSYYNYNTRQAFPAMKYAYYSETGSPWYQANSDTVSLPNRRCDDSSNRWETNVGSTWNDLGYEVVGYLKPPKGSMTGTTEGSHVGLKHGGPNHTPPCDYTVGGKCCCWWDGGLRRNGTPYLEIEYPHPNNIHESRYSNMGRYIDNGSTLGIRWSLRKSSGYHIRRLRLWVDTSGGRNYKWRKMYDYTDSGGKMPQSYAITSHQNIEIRVSDIKCSDVNWSYGPYARKMV